MQPHAKHIDVFVRTGVWFVQIANNYGQNKEYDQSERDEFRHNPKALVAHAKDIEDQVNGLWGAFYADSEAQKMGAQMFGERMERPCPCSCPWRFANVLATGRTHQRRAASQGVHAQVRRRVPRESICGTCYLSHTVQD